MVEPPTQRIAHCRICQYRHLCRNYRIGEETPGNDKQGEQWIQERLHQFTANYPDRDEEPLTAVKPEQLLVVTGRIAPALCAAALKIEADAIVVGTRAKHSLRDHLFGSVTTQLIGQTPCPLIIIPEGAAYKTVSRIALAVDIKQHEEPVLPALQSIATALDTEIHPFYVNFCPKSRICLRKKR